MAVSFARNAAFRPFQAKAFRTIWLATLVSNIGSWVSSVATVWLMTTMTGSGTLVSLVQAFSTLPIFLLGLPAGALADILDRRRILLGAQAFMMAVAVALTLLQAAGTVTPLVLLVLTFLLGAGTAVAAPAFQSIVPELVPRDDVKAAVSLNSVGINIARALGPALGGALVTAVGLTVAFAVNAATFLCAVAAFVAWRAPARPSTLPPEHWGSAMRVGIRYVREAPEFRATLWRAVAFFFPAAAYWALLPLFAKQQLAGDATTYGVLLGSIGAGAVGGAFLLPVLRGALKPRALLLAGGLATAGVMAVLSIGRTLPVAVATLVVAGMAWIAMLSTLNLTALSALPVWVKSRGLAVYIVVFNGALAAGSVTWGRMTDVIGLPAALQLAAVLLALSSLLTLRVQLARDDAELAPSRHWPAPPTEPIAHADDDGQVMVTVEYEVPAAQANDFVHALQQLGRTRRRDGATYWHHFVDAQQPTRHVEVFVLDSWYEHLRQHERFPVQDRPLQLAVQRFHTGAAPPRVTHYRTYGGTEKGDRNGSQSGTHRVDPERDRTL